MSATGEAEITVRLDAVAKRYGAFDAVRGVSLSLRAGEVFGFLGPNGAGKTTTIKMISGLLRPDSGTVEICGIPMARRPEEAKQLLGYIPDRPFLYEKLTAWEFLRFVAGIYEVPPAEFEPRADRLLRLLGMARWRDGLIEGFSHGMKQRVVMAAAFVHAPKVLVVDEPMVGLDPAGARLVKDAFKEWAAQGNTVFLSTHSLDVAEELCDRIAIIAEGRVLDLGSLPELRARHAKEDRTLEQLFLDLTAAARPADPDPA